MLKAKMLLVIISSVKLSETKTNFPLSQIPEKKLIYWLMGNSRFSLVVSLFDLKKMIRERIWFISLHYRNGPVSNIKKSAVEDSEEEGRRGNLMIFFEKMPPDSYGTFLQMHLFYSSLS